MDSIKVKGAREHNLKNINFEIPRNKLTSIIGVSGSGKSTIAFDIIFSEGQRQYLESVSVYARQFLRKSNKANVDSVEGLSPTIVIEQKVIRDNPRSTVGTVTELYNYLRLLFSRAGTSELDAKYFSFNSPLGACPECKGLGRKVEIDVNKLIDFDKNLNEGAIKHRSWKVGGRYWNIIRAIEQFDMDKKIKDYDKKELDLLLYSPPKQWQNKHSGFIQSFSYMGIAYLIKRRNSSAHRSMDKYDLPYFSAVQKCEKCNGGRLNEKALSARINGKNIGEVADMQLNEILNFIKNIKHKNAEPIIPRMVALLNFLIEVGLDYLSLNRSIDTLSAGESQRIKLARQLGNDLIETIYVMDEPTMGLHPKNVDTIVRSLKQLKELQNTVIVVEHDPTVILSSDYILEVGPGAGKFGGKIVYCGTPKEILNSPKSLSGQYLSGKKEVCEKKERSKAKEYLEMKNVSENNLKNIDVKIPLEILTVITGVSGAGKSSLIEALMKKHSDKIVLIDQSPVGSTPRANPATYVGAFDIIRELFGKENKVDASIFSFNSKGACSDCKGLGYSKIDMQFLGDIKVECDTCKGKRYLSEILNYKVNKKNISEVLEMTASEANSFFDNPELNKKFSLLEEVGLGYLELGQPLDTLSGGESQRIKLVKELSKKSEFYVLDEPTKGLHMADIDKLLKLLNRLVSNGNTVLVVEHNLDVIKNADWIIDLGPEGGNKGGEIVAQGTPEQVAKNAKSYTGQYLKKVI